LRVTSAPRTRRRVGIVPVESTELIVKHEDTRTVAQFSDAELEAILRRKVGVVPVDSDEQRPTDATFN
jgi:hypothetical protein